MVKKYIEIEIDRDASISSILDLLKTHNVDPSDACLDVDTYEDQDSMGGSWTGATVHLVIPEGAKK